MTKFRELFVQYGTTLPQSTGNFQSFVDLKKGSYFKQNLWYGPITSDTGTVLESLL